MNPDIASIPIRDIHLPHSVSWWPLAPGWWITLGLLLLVIAVVYFLKFMKDRTQLQKQTMNEFENLVNQYKNDRDISSLLSNVSQLLRRVSITRFGHTEVAALTGDSWLMFLDEILEKAKTNKAFRFQGELGELLVTGQYRKAQSVDEVKLDQLLVLTKSWLLIASKSSIKPDFPLINHPLQDSQPRDVQLPIQQAVQLSSQAPSELRGER